MTLLQSFAGEIEAKEKVVEVQTAEGIFLAGQTLGNRSSGSTRESFYARTSRTACGQGSLPSWRRGFPARTS
jgi:hypothetical protein